MRDETAVFDQTTCSFGMHRIFFRNFGAALYEKPVGAHFIFVFFRDCYTLYLLFFLADQYPAMVFQLGMAKRKQKGEMQRGEDAKRVAHVRESKATDAGLWCDQIRHHDQRRHQRYDHQIERDGMCLASQLYKAVLPIIHSKCTSCQGNFTFLDCVSFGKLCDVCGRKERQRDHTL